MHDCVISKSLVVQKEFVDQDKGDAHLQKKVKGKKYLCSLWCGKIGEISIPFFPLQKLCNKYTIKNTFSVAYFHLESRFFSFFTQVKKQSSNSNRIIFCHSDFIA